MGGILIGQSYYMRFDAKLWEAMKPYPPLGALYAASHLRSLGFEVSLFDAMLAESTAEWEEAVVRSRPRIVVLYEDSFNYLSKMCLLRMRHAAFEMMAVARRHGATVIVSASDATDHRRLYFEKGADYLLLGEGEITLGELVSALVRGGKQDVEKIPGVCVPDWEGPPRDLLRNLDVLPLPAWDLVDVEKYRQIWMSRHGRFSINMVSTRGCPYQCNWCAKPVYGQRYHSRSPHNVCQELEFLRQAVKPDHIWFCDDIFGLKPGWIEEFSDLVVERKLQTPFKCLLRTDLVTPRISRALRRAGCESVWMGAESGSQRILDAMDKGATVEDTQRATRLLREQGMEVGFFLQFGYRGEEWHDIRETFELVRRCRPDDIGVSVAYPLPGTKFYETVHREIGERKNWEDSQDLAMLYRGPFSTEFYRQLHTTLHREFRGRKALDELRQGKLTHLPDLFRTLLLPLDRWRLKDMRSRSIRNSGGGYQASG